MYRLLFIIVLLVSACQDNKNEWREVDLKAFKIELAPGWSYVPMKSADSSVGQLTHGLDTLTYYFGALAPEFGPGWDKRVVRNTVNGLYAEIIILESDTLDLVGMSIPQFKNGKDKFLIGGSNMKASDEILRMFKSIRFPESDTSNNPKLEIKDNVVANSIDGKALFQSNCASCHHILKDATGPSFKSFSEIRSKDWLYSFIRNRKELKDDSLLRVVIKWNADFDCLQFPNLSKNQIDAIFDYAPGCGGFKVN